MIIRDAFHLIGGGTPSTTEPKYWGTGIPWISSSDIDDFHNISVRRFVTDKGVEESATNRVSKGTVIVVTRVGLGKVALLSQDMCFSQDIQALIPKSNVSICSKFMLFQLEQLMSSLKYESQGTTISGITKKQLSDASLYLPPLPEQERIVARIEELFSELDKGVEALQTIKAQLRVYRQAVLKKAFEPKSGWVIKTTAEIGDVNLGRQRSPKNVSNNFPTNYIRAANITEQGLDLSDLLEMEFTPIEREKYTLVQGDIILSEASGSIRQVGKPAIWNSEVENCCFQNTVIRHRVNGANPKYIFWYYKYCYVSGLFSKIVGGVGINHIGAKNFSEFTVPVAPMEDQLSIVAEIESRLSVCDQIEKTVDESLAKAESLRQSILKKAFEGRL